MASRLAPIIVAAGALVFASSLAGCPSKKPKGPACAGDQDCKDGLVCINKECKACSSNAQCPSGKCKSGKCETAGECKTDTDCPAGRICQGGACKACTADAQCGPGGKCVGGACNRPTKCTKDDDCKDDEDCINGVCLNPSKPTDVAASCTLNTVYFAFDDASIQAGERDRLDGNEKCMGKNPARNVYLVGHTDSSGTDEYNIALSERRGRTVADYLARLGVDPAKLQVVPKGETELTGQGDDKDRRVEFQWR